jgi:hypothetical protein
MIDTKETFENRDHSLVVATDVVEVVLVPKLK